MTNPFPKRKHPDRILPRCGTLFAVSLAVMLIAGCGDSGEPSTSSGEAETSVRSSMDQNISRLISTMELTREEYREAFDDGTLVDKAEYQEAWQMGIQRAQSQFEKLRSQLAKRNAEQTDQIGSTLDSLHGLIKNKDPISGVTSRIDSTIDLLRSLRDSAGNALTAAYRKQVSELDTLLHAEKQTGGYRIGVFAKTPTTTFTPDGRATEPPSDSFYLGITLREKRTKRYLPGSTVHVKIGDQTVTLTETWGKFHHYGTHVSASVSSDAEIKVSVSPPAYGRHAEMKSVYLEPASVSFPVKKADLKDHPVFSGPAPKSLSSDHEIGSGIKTATAESKQVKTAGPYKVGFIVEGAEPFWTWSDGKLNAHPGTGQNQNHLEIVLLDKKTNEPLPHANISLNLSGENTDNTVDLYPLLAEFYHYGNNAAVPPGSYTVTATIKHPRVHTLKSNRFTDETVTFDWTKSSQ